MVLYHLIPIIVNHGTLSSNPITPPNIINREKYTFNSTILFIIY